MDLLDQIMSQTRSEYAERAPVILSEQHDTGSINFVAGMSDPGEMIRCGYRPELRRITGETDATYAARIRPLVMALPVEERQLIMNAAIARAGLDTSNGRVNVMVAGKTPWHALGVNVESATNSNDTRELAGLMHTSSKRPLQFLHNGEMQDQTDAYAIVRDDTGACMGTVGNKHVIIQIGEAFQFMDEVLAQYGARYSSAGSIHGGKKVWMQADLPNSSFTVGTGDEVKCYALFTNPYDGSGKAFCFPTSERTVCANTLRIATARDQGKGIGLRHSANLKSKVKEAQAALGLTVELFDAYKTTAQQLARTRITCAVPYVNAVLDEILPVTAEDARQGAEVVARSRKVNHDISPDEMIEAIKDAEKQIKHRAETWNDIMSRYDSEKCNVNGIGGTAWSALQAVTEFADHHDARRKVGTTEAQASRRFESVLSGDRDEIKQVAYAQAIQFAAKA